MSTLGIKISELQKRISIVKNELSEINKKDQPLPEFIDKANLLRSNEHLQRANDQKSKLIISYEEYAKELERIVSSVLEIKGNLNDLKSKFSRKKATKSKRKKQSRKKIKKRKTKSKSRRKVRKKRR